MYITEDVPRMEKCQSVGEFTLHTVLLVFMYFIYFIYIYIYQCQKMFAVNLLRTSKVID